MVWNVALYLLILLILFLLMAFVAVRYSIFLQEEKVARALILAERDFNNLISGGLSHGGRLERVAERREWNKLAQVPTIQINTDGYKSIAHELVAANEKELGGKGNTMGKASITAFLLRELYQGLVDNAQIKIAAETRNGGALPYVAPGIDQLVGLDKFNPITFSFPPDAGVEPWLLRRVVRNWGFPREILMVQTLPSGEKLYRPPLQALEQLIQQNL